MPVFSSGPQGTTEGLPLEVPPNVKRRSDFPPLPLLMPDESEERAVLASIYAAVRPPSRHGAFEARRRSARGIEAMSLRVRDNAHRYLRMLQD